jgi:hypothetical protein
MNRYRLALIAALVLSIAATARAQIGGEEGVTIQPFQSRLDLPIPGLWWFGATAADSNAGFGFESGSYFTIGNKVLLFEDPLNGNWMLESRVHAVEQNGNWFGNFGLERSFFLEPANTDLGLSVWYDGDFDRPEQFGHQFNQIGVSGFIKNPFGDFRANGYIPVGTTDYLEPIGPFTGNIILIPGQDSALQGFDMVYRIRIPQYGAIGGYVDLGGYSYRSTLVEPFGGFKMRAGVASVNGLQIVGEYNHDDVFKSTGFLQVVLAGGAAAPSTTSSGREYEPTPRNDHIVRFHRDRMIAINPVTGLPYNVIHVNNQVGGAGSGTFEDPFMSLALAQAGSMANDVIFVNSSPLNYGGIVLQNGQFLLGEGVNHSLPVPGGVFVLQTAGVPVPTLNNAVGPGVTLATGPNPNLVSGFQIQAGPGQDAIFGMNVVAGATLNDLVLVGGGGAAGSGINLQNSSGSFPMTNVAIQTFDGPAFNVVGGAPNINFSGSIINVIDRAVQITGTTGGTINMAGSINDNGGTGIQLLNTGGNVNISANTLLQNNPGNALDITGGTGNFTFSSLGIVNAGGAGVLVAGGTGNTAITLSGTGLTNVGGRAVDIQNMTGGSVTFNPGGIISDAGGAGIFVNNNNATISFNTPVDVTTNAATAVTATTNAAVSFADLDVLATDRAGVLAQNNNSFTIATGTITTVNGGGGGGTALTITNAVTGAANVNLVSLTAANAQAGQSGVLLQNLTGTTNLGVAAINVTGGGNGILANNAGTIATAVGSAAATTNNAVLNIANSTIAMNFNTLNSTNSLAQGVALTFLGAGSTLNVSGTTTITNALQDGFLVANSNAVINLTAVTINMNAAGRHGISLTNNAVTSNFTLNGGTINMNAANASNGVNIVNSIGTVNNTNISNIAATGSGISVASSGGSTSTVLFNNNTLTAGIGGNAITLASNGAGATLNATVTNNIIAATANSIAATATAGGTLHLNAFGNNNGAGIPPVGNIAITAAGGTTFNVTQLSTLDLSVQNNGVGVTQAGVINFNAGPAPVP